MNRYTTWVRAQIEENHPDASENKQSVAALADACATLSGKGSLLFGMNMPAELEEVPELYAEACAALAAWFAALEPDEAAQLAARIRTQDLDVEIPTSNATDDDEDDDDEDADEDNDEDADADDEHDPVAFAALCERLVQEREQSLKRFGTVSTKVLARARPILLDGTLYPWPANAIGALRFVRTPDSVLLVTDGLSSPWDPTLHGDVPDWTFGYELAIEVPLAAFPDSSDEAIARSWAPVVLWAATDWVVAERADLLGRLETFDVITHAIPPVGGLERLVASNGMMGGLVGMPLRGTTLGASVGHGPDPHVPGAKTLLLTLKLLTADEYEWAIGVPDSSRAVTLATQVLNDGGHLTWPNRTSALGRIT